MSGSIGIDVKQAPVIHATRFALRPTPRGAFTLIELLVSISVLTVLILLVTQLVNSASLTIASSDKYMNADTEMRVIFNRMAVDFGRMPKRTDLDYSCFKQPAGKLSAQYGSAAIPSNPQPGNDQLAFYSETDGYSDTQALTGALKAPCSLVSYYISSGSSNNGASGAPILLRMGKALGWDPAGPGNAWTNMSYLPLTITSKWSQLFGSDPDYKTVGYQVFRLEYTYLLKANESHAAKFAITPYDTTATPAHTAINGFQDVAAIVVAIAVLDSASRAIVHDYTKLTSQFADAQDGADIATSWNAAINGPNFAASAGIPRSAASAVRVYQRSFYLDSPP